MIGLLTFYWADDYGAMLQAYALKNSIEKIADEKVEVIPYAPVKFTGRYWLCPIIAYRKNEKIKYRLNTYQFLRNIFNFRSMIIRKRNMKLFRRRYLTNKCAVMNENHLSVKKYTNIFVGSDQIWNPEITVGLDKVYTGRIKKKGNCLMTAYAASLGKSSIPESDCAEFKQAVNKNFFTISMREKSAAEFVSRLLRKKISDVLDPTLLLDQSDWIKLAKLPKDRNYILVYFTEYNKKMMQYIYKISKRLRKKVIQITIPIPGKMNFWNGVQIKGGPGEFIGYFKNADCIVTNSFHGTVFSILFEKKFLVFSHSNKNERIESLLKKLDLEINLIQAEDQASYKSLYHKIDWKHVRYLLEREREFSLKFIEQSIYGINQGK